MEAQKSSIGSIIGTIIIIAIIILGGLYFWGKRIEESKNVQPVAQTTTETTPVDPAQAEADTIKTTSSSDTTASIDADLKSTNTTGMSTELQ